MTESVAPCQRHWQATGDPTATSTGGRGSMTSGRFYRWSWLNFATGDEAASSTVKWSWRRSSGQVYGWPGSCDRWYRWSWLWSSDLV